MEYEEVDTEFTVNDFVFIGVSVLSISILLIVIFKGIRKTFKNFHLKIGNKIELKAELES